MIYLWKICLFVIFYVHVVGVVKANASGDHSAVAVSSKGGDESTAPITSTAVLLADNNHNHKPSITSSFVFNLTLPVVDWAEVAGMLSSGSKEQLLAQLQQLKTDVLHNTTHFLLPLKEKVDNFTETQSIQLREQVLRFLHSANQTLTYSSLKAAAVLPYSHRLTLYRLQRILRLQKECELRQVPFHFIYLHSPSVHKQHGSRDKERDLKLLQDVLPADSFTLLEKEDFVHMARNLLKQEIIVKQNTQVVDEMMKQSDYILLAWLWKKKIVTWQSAAQSIHDHHDVHDATGNSTLQDTKGKSNKKNLFIKLIDHIQRLLKKNGKHSGSNVPSLVFENQPARNLWLVDAKVDWIGSLPLILDRLAEPFLFADYLVVSESNSSAGIDFRNLDSQRQFTHLLDSMVNFISQKDQETTAADKEIAINTTSHETSPEQESSDIGVESCVSDSTIAQYHTAPSIARYSLRFVKHAVKYHNKDIKDPTKSIASNILASFLTAGNSTSRPKLLFSDMLMFGQQKGYLSTDFIGASNECVLESKEHWKQMEREFNEKSEELFSNQAGIIFKCRSDDFEQM